jgi:hypothetical protein
MVRSRPNGLTLLQRPDAQQGNSLEAKTASTRRAGEFIDLVDCAKR